MDLRCELANDSGLTPDPDAIPDVAGVLRLDFVGGAPYLARTARLRRRVKRLLRFGKAAGEELRSAIRRVAYQPTGSAFESALLLYEQARIHRPDDYRRYLKLRTPPLLKVQLRNPYPRTHVTTRLSGRRALFFGPFTSRVSAERFESAFLDLFRIRRCSEELDPTPSHPGCIYGEMDMCLRPCQDRVSIEDYHAEVGRVLEFLHTGGQSLSRAIEQERNQASQELEFEEAARQHRRLLKLQEALKLKDELARDLDQLLGFVVQPSIEPQAVELWMLYKGFFQPRFTFSLAVDDGRPVSLDRRLRDAVEAMELKQLSRSERADHLALLRRWHGSTWRSGEIVLFDRIDRVPYRKLVNAVARVAGGRRSDDHRR